MRQQPAVQTEKETQDLKKEIKSKFMSKSVFMVLAAVMLVGVTTGYVVAYVMGGSSVKVRQAGESGAVSVSVGEIVGSDDLETFKDVAEGVLKEGGIDGEGEFHLERPGGESQNVYLTSSIVDLSEFEGKKIKVWGQTYESEHAGWLMDVGRVQILE